MLTHTYRWRNNPQLGLYPCPKRATLFGRACRVVARGRMNSALVEFENGQREVVSRNAIRLKKNSDTHKKRQKVLRF